MIRHNQIKFNLLTKDIFLRNDPKFYNFITSKKNWNVFGSANKLIPLGKILKKNEKQFRFIDGEEYKGVPTGKGYIDDDGVIIKFEKINLQNRPSRIKYSGTYDSIYISSVRLARSPAFILENKH